MTSPDPVELRALSASEEACYRWPEDTAEHRAMRAAYVDGASRAPQPSMRPDQSPATASFDTTARMREALEEALNYLQTSASIRIQTTAPEVVAHNTKVSECATRIRVALAAPQPIAQAGYGSLDNPNGAIRSFVNRAVPFHATPDEELAESELDVDILSDGSCIPAITDDELWALTTALHSNVPEADRPMSWSDYSPEQIQRLREAAKAFLGARLAPSRPTARPDREVILLSLFNEIELFSKRSVHDGGTRHLAIIGCCEQGRAALATQQPKQRGEDMWPAGCHSPNSCDRNSRCMYVGCKHDGQNIRNLADAAKAAEPEREGK